MNSNLILERQSAILNGVPLYDTDGAVVNAHGACIVQDGGRFYLFGEYKRDDRNTFCGFSCYVSDDLLQWQFVRMALPVTPGTLASGDRVGERVKVMRCPKTGAYLLYFHSDNARYCDQYTAYATSDRIDGEYRIQGAVCLNGTPLRHWDMGVFQDDDGAGYVLENHGDIYRLSDDYTYAVEKLVNVRENCTAAPDTDLDGLGVVGESPALFTYAGTYYLLYSDTTSWEKNDNYYLTAPSIRGPWTRRGVFCPRGSLTHNSQTTFVLPLGGGRFLYMGDRWSFPHQASAATYVWLSLHVEPKSARLRLAPYATAWNPQTQAAVEVTAGWKSCGGTRTPASAAGAGVAGEGDCAIERLSAQCAASQIAVIGSLAPDGCYARVSISSGGAIVCEALIDFYAKVPEQDGLRYLSPVLPPADYTVEITNLHDKPNWTDKTQRLYGSTGCAVRVREIRFRER